MLEIIVLPEVSRPNSQEIEFYSNLGSPDTLTKLEQIHNFL